jgi:hypothetical protein
MQRLSGTTEPLAVQALWFAGAPTSLWAALSRHPAALLLCVMAVLVCAAASRSASSVDADRASIIVARQLYASSEVPSQSDVGPQLRAPGYPLMLTAMARLDPGFGSGLSCASEVPDGCGDAFPFLPLVVLQVLATLLSLVLVYRLALLMSGSQEVALIALVLTFICGRFGDMAGGLFSDSWYQLGAISSVYLMASATVRLNSARLAAAGAYIGLTSLIEPTFLVLAPVAAIATGVAARKQGARSSIGLAACVLAGCAAGVIPFLILAQHLGYDLGAIARHMSWHLAERVAFNQLDALSWWAGLVKPIPLSDPVVGVLFPTEITSRFGYYVPGTYVYDGANRIFPDALAQPGSPHYQMFRLVETHVLLEWRAYVLSSVPIFMRGVFGAAGLIGLLGIMHLPTMLRWTKTSSRYRATVLVVLMTAALLIANTLLTANPANLNPTLAFAYAYSIAYVAAGL